VNSRAQKLARELLARSSARFLLGIAGPPGSGKSTLAAELAAALNCEARQEIAAVVALDGFHLPNAELDRRGLRPRKGAPETFDAPGLVTLLTRLRRSSRTVLAPIYSRELHEPVSHAVRIGPAIRLIIVEGNYLLLDQGPWSPVRALLDETWYLQMPCEVCMARVRDRHIRGGCSAELAAEKIETNDRPNYEIVAATRPRASRVIE